MKALSIFCAATAVSACGLVFESPSVRVVDVRLSSLGLTSGSAVVGLAVANPNRYDLRVQGFTYQLEIAESGRPDTWSELAAQAASDTTLLPGRDTVSVALRVPFRYQSLGVAVLALLQEGSVRYRFRGEAGVRGPLGTFQVPFDERGSITP